MTVIHGWQSGKNSSVDSTARVGYTPRKESGGNIRNMRSGVRRPWLLHRALLSVAPPHSLGRHQPPNPLQPLRSDSIDPDQFVDRPEGPTFDDPPGDYWTDPGQGL